RRHGAGEARPRAVHGDGQRGGRDPPATLLDPHRSDHQRARALGPQLELAGGRAHRAAERLERYLRDFARPDDRESRERGEGQGHRGGGSGPGANREQQVVTRGDVRAVHARRDVGCRPALQRGEHPEREHHQSFTPGSTARRVWPVRSRPVLSLCWPIERRTSSACAGLMPPCTPAPPWERPRPDPPPAALWGPPPPLPPEGGLLRLLPPCWWRTASSRFHLAPRSCGRSSRASRYARSASARRDSRAALSVMAWRNASKPRLKSARNRTSGSSDAAAWVRLPRAVSASESASAAVPALYHAVSSMRRAASSARYAARAPARSWRSHAFSAELRG